MADLLNTLIQIPINQKVVNMAPDLLLFNLLRHSFVSKMHRVSKKQKDQKNQELQIHFWHRAPLQGGSQDMTEFILYFSGANSQTDL